MIVSITFLINLTFLGAPVVTVMKDVPGGPSGTVGTMDSTESPAWVSVSSGSLERRMMPVVFGTAAPAGARRRRRIVIYCRYSDPNQNPASLDDQESACRKHIGQLGLDVHAEILVIREPAISGERGERPGLSRLWGFIEASDCDVIVAEETSRLFRHGTRAMQLIEAAVDADIRVLTINDPIDTANDDWRLNGQFASMKAELDNRQTRQRIRRAMESRWAAGYVVGSTLRSGYLRVPVHARNGDQQARGPDYQRRPDYDDRPERGPYIEKRDDRWTPVIRKSFVMCADGERPWVIARFLKQSGLPRSSRAPDDEWTEADVRKMIRDPIYRGEEVYGVTHVKRRYSRADSIIVPTEAEDVWRREMLHLRHVPDWVWFRANEAIVANRSRTTCKKGSEHPLAGIRRDRRGPLSKLFFCGVCGAPMYRDGRRYRCGDAKPSPTMKRRGVAPCWNRCMPGPEIVHAKLGTAIVDTLIAQQGCFETLVPEVHRLIQQGDGQTAKQLKTLRRRDAELERICARLMKALERDGDLEEVVKQLRVRKRERQEVRTEMERLTAQQDTSIPLPTADEIRGLLDDAKTKLLGEMGPEVGPLLRRLISRIEAHVYAVFDTNDLVLRAHFSLSLVGLLPQTWGDLIANRLSDEAVADVIAPAVIPLVVDLFEMPARIRYAGAVAELIAAGASVQEAAEKLEIGVWTARDAVKTAQVMAARGIADAYIRVTSMPQRPPRWKPHSGRPDVFNAV